MRWGWLTSRTGVDCKFRNRSGGLLSTANHGVSGWNTDADGRGEAIDAVTSHGKPSSGIEQVGDGIADISELQSPYGTVISRLDRPFVFKDERLAGSLLQTIRQRYPDRRILADALDREHLPG